MSATEIIATTFEAGQTVVLRRRGEAYDVIVGSVVLLSSAALETEWAFGRLSAELAIPARRILVGGLGFGATARGALDVVGDGGKVIVVEKLAAIVAFLKGPLASLAGGLFDDPRLELVIGDVGDVIATTEPVDALLLDVDNGPGWASFRGNARLYGDAGLAAARACVRPSGIFAVWSGYPADAFLPRLRAAGMQARVVPLREKGVVRARAYVGVVPERGGRFSPIPAR